MTDKTATPALVGDHPLDALATRMLERIRNNPRIVGLWSNSAVRSITTQDLLAASLEALVQDGKAKLELMQGITALSKQAVEEKRRGYMEKASPRVMLNDCIIPAARGEAVELWEVRGHDAYPTRSFFYPTKMCAEIAARAAFPDEDEDTRYGRIYFSRFVREL